MSGQHDLIVNAVTLVANFMVPPLTKLAADHPLVRVRYNASVEIRPWTTAQPGAATTTAIALRGGRRPSDAGMEVRFLGLLSVALFAVESYIARFGTVETTDDLARHRIVHTDLDRATTPWDYWLASLGEGMPRVVLHSNLEAVHCAAVLSGECAGFMPVSSMLTNPRLRPLMEPLDEWSAPLWMVSPPLETMTEPVAALCAQLRDVLRRSLGGA